jgi:ATP-dependent Lhr-like helicase
MNVYERYAPFVQEFIYRNGWQSLRAIQAAAGDAIFNTEDNLLLCASTASGKTEAAFFPILTLLYENPPTSIGTLYIGPLKALINDQFSRLTELCEEADIPVWHWHGDVPASHKSKLLKHPSGILQITPESLEALMLHKHAAIASLFHDLRFVVIDEVHSLMRGDRGGQTICLLERLARMSGSNPRRIGLSATIGDLESAGTFLGAGTGRSTIIPRVEGPKETWRLSMEHFYVTGPQGSEEQEDSELVREAKQGGFEDAYVMPQMRPSEPDEAADMEMATAPASDEAPKAADPGIGYIFEHTRDQKCLVFCNSREEAESVTTILRQYCEAKHEPDRFLIHHGNLSASLRMTAEDAMKDETLMLTTVTTSTLELGIDIGRLERAFQLDAPFTVSSFLQRMGRTGRRGQPSEMWFVMREDPPEPRAMLPENIPWKLLQGIALVQVYLEERWVEPPRFDRLPYSLLYHQTMSTLASGGEMTPAELAARVLSLTSFYRVSQDDYRILLRHLIAMDHIQMTERGGLIVGLAGERITNSYRFYAVFQENEEYTVRADSEELGTIVKPPPIGDKIAIAGHVWVVEEVDHKRHCVYCQMVKGNVPAYFGECPGDIHTHILERMRQVLREEKPYPYLMQNAVARIALARDMAGYAGIPDEPLISLGGGMWALFPWLGTYSFMALERFLKIRCAALLGLKGLESAKPYYMQFTMKADRNAFYEIVTREAERPIDAMELLYPKEVPVFEKYDEFVPEELVRKGFAYGVLDLEGMLDRVRSWSGMIPAKIKGEDRSRLQTNTPV